MDSRATLQQGESFLALLTELKQQGKPAAVLFDEQGPTRAAGLVTDIHVNADPAYFLLNNNQMIEIDKLIALNGIFRSDYSEC